MSFLPAQFNDFLSLKENRSDFIMKYLSDRGLKSSKIVIDGKSHVLVQYDSSFYNSSFRIKTVVAHTKCHGKGSIRKTKTIEVDVPAGIDAGQMIKLSGQGELGTRGGPRGDLYIEVDVKSHSIFTREGYDVYLEMPITFAQATLGDKIQVPTLDGKVEYEIPEGTQTGTVFRLKGKGITKLRSNVRGDQYVKVTVEIPKNLNDKQKDLVRQFAKECGQEVHERQKSLSDKIDGFFKSLKKKNK